MNSSPQRDEQLFVQAIELPAVHRASFLDGACGTDAALRARIDALLVAHDGPESLIAAAIIS